MQQASESAHSNHKLKNVWVKLQAVKQALKGFHTSKFSKAHCKVDDFREKLAAIQALPDLNHEEEKFAMNPYYGEG